jgi:hypothetical protein
MKNFNWNFVLAIVASLAAMFVVVSAVEYLSHMIYPLPDVADPYDKDMLKAHIALAPVEALVLVPIGWILGAFLGSFLGGYISKTKKQAIFFIVAIFTLMAAVMNMILLPSPWYFWALSALIFPAALVGSRLVPSK